MSTISRFIVCMLFAVSAEAATIRGTVQDVAGSPLAGATVVVGNQRMTTEPDGRFSFEVADGRHRVTISSNNYQSQMRSVLSGDDVTFRLQPAHTEAIVVSAIRADDATPVTKTDVEREEIERRYHGQDLPLLLRDAPSMVTFSESGVGGSGYSYFTIRGITPTRINITLDGVPLSDSEDMGVYFVDFPDLARSLDSVQIQRGVGTSTFGTAGFAGSVNLASIVLAPESRTEATLGGGSYGNQQLSVAHHSGPLPGGVQFYTRLSVLENEGYRDNSATEQRNVFFSGSKTLGSGLLKLTGFAGLEEMQSSYYAVEPEILETDPTFNPLQPEEKDRFHYDLAQLQYIQPLSSTSDMTASVYYQSGYGWFRLFKSGTDTLREYGLDGKLFGTMLTLSKKSGGLTANYGLHVNEFRRDHTRDIVSTGERNYENHGVKGEANAFAKFNWGAGPWQLFADAQVRHATFEYHGSVPINDINWTFFNPKFGARYQLNGSSSVYASLGMATREPGRNDMLLGEDNPDVPVDLNNVKPERVVDFELGWNRQLRNLDLTANLYAMEFRNEIAATGEQSETGMSLRENVDRSYRRGLELEAAWQASSMLRLRTSANVSRNRIREWTQFYDVYDAGGNWVEAKPITYENVEPVLTPSVIVSQTIDVAPGGMFEFSVTGRYVDRAFLDNTNHERLATPSYTLVDAGVVARLSRWIDFGDPRLTLQVNNLLDEERVWASGYSYPYITRDSSEVETVGGQPYFYPQAPRNFVLMLDLRM